MLVTIYIHHWRPEYISWRSSTRVLARSRNCQCHDDERDPLSGAEPWMSPPPLDGSPAIDQGGAGVFAARGGLRSTSVCKRRRRHEGNANRYARGVSEWNVRSVVQWHLWVITINFKRYFRFYKVGFSRESTECCFSLLVHF